MRPSVLYPLTVALGIIACATFYQSCGQFVASSNLNAGTSVQPSQGDPTSFNLPLPAYGLLSSVTVGDFVTLPAGKDLNMNISGRALMTRTADGETRVDVSAFGLPANALVAAHVHVLPCAQAAGGHYKIDTNVAGTVRANEIWPMIFSDANGYGYGTITVNHSARPDAVSVVIHGGPSAAKVACADLKVPVVQPAVETGSFALVGTGPTPITGRALLVRKQNGQTEVRSAVSGLTAATAYASHLHDLDCAGNGGHYKIDPTNAAAVETNEVWPLFTTNATGQGLGIKTVDHTVRTGPLSVVVHNPVGGTKLACASLTSGGGAFLPTDIGLTRNRMVAGIGTIERLLNGGTKFVINVTGLAPNTTYMSHVHNRPCIVGAGGHYKVDNSVTAAVELNEIWLTLSSDAAGAAQATVTSPHTARPDAMALMIHDTDGAKIACADLYQ